MSSLVYVTCGDFAEARALARTLVGEGLCAGVNLLDGMTSIYRWRGAVRERGECLFIAQVGAEALERCMARIRELHSYETPCIVALADGHKPFLDWIERNGGG